MACEGCEERRRTIARYIEAMKQWTRNPLSGPMPLPPVINIKSENDSDKPLDVPQS